MSRDDRVELAGLVVIVLSFIVLVLGLWLISTALALIVGGIVGLIVGILVVRRAQQMNGDA